MVYLPPCAPPPPLHPSRYSSVIPAEAGIHRPKRGMLFAQCQLTTTLSTRGSLNKRGM